MQYTLPLDGYAPYVREDTCSPTVKPGALALEQLLTKTYGTTIATNIVRKCSASASGHEEGRSIDWMTHVRKPAQKALAEDLIAWLLAPDSQGNRHVMARRLGVSYLIWDSRMIVLTGPSAQWREYSGCLTSRRATTYDTTCHRDHVHISLGWPGAMGQTSFYQQSRLRVCRPTKVSASLTSTPLTSTQGARVAAKAPGGRHLRSTCSVSVPRTRN